MPRNVCDINELRMDLFENTFDVMKDYAEKRSAAAAIFSADANDWPSGAGRNVVLSDDMAVELGSPQTASTSVLLWTENPGRVRDGRITLIGPDIGTSADRSLPFGKVVLVCVSGFNEDNIYERYKEMEAVRYAMDLKGYMMRAASQYQREWSRISREALQNGFSFTVLGGALRNGYLKKDYIHAVEFLFVTSDIADVNELGDITRKVSRTINAMDKMFSEMKSDCDECEYNDVCDEVSDLKKMRNARNKKRGE